MEVIVWNNGPAALIPGKEGWRDPKAGMNLRRE